MCRWTLAPSVPLLAVGAIALSVGLVTRAADEERPILSASQVIPVGRERTLAWSASGAVRAVEIADERIVRRVRLSEGNGGWVILRGLAPGTTRVTVTDDKGKREIVEVVVRRQVTLPVGVTYPLRRSDGKPLRAAVSSNEKVCRVERATDDPALVYLNGLASGTSHVTLTDPEGRPERHEVIVRAAQLIIALGDMKPLPRKETKGLPPRKAPRTLVNERDDVLYVIAISSTTVVVEARAVGVSTVILRDVEDNEERIDVGVRPYGYLALPAGIRYRLRMYKTQPIRKAASEDEKLALVRTAPGEPNAVDIETRAEGTQPDHRTEGITVIGPSREGRTQVILTGQDGTVESYDLYVREVGVLLRVGGKRRLQLNTKREIAEITCWPKPKGAVRVDHVAGDSTTVEVVALAVGVAQVSLRDKDGRWETVYVGVKPAARRNR
jgi:hypothetical protein